MLGLRIRIRLFDDSWSCVIVYHTQRSLNRIRRFGWLCGALKSLLECEINHSRSECNRYEKITFAFLVANVLHNDVSLLPNRNVVGNTRDVNFHRCLARLKLL